MEKRFAIITILCFCGLLISLQAGCIQTTQSAAEEEHLEHHIPEHKPESFSATVSEIKTRMKWLLENNQAEESQVKTQELAEIIAWIPEMAADSELKHREWNEVKQLSTQLNTIFQQIDLTTADSELVDQYFLLVKNLNEFTARSEMNQFNH
ncbi:hypothetical protein [Gimesia aquarii]|uniref:Uncharacterized protein n=1 Tax=Gimesia aquarii TaxID=2527964 RepID=A0A517WQM5_9PLAN|nr:hypothetical protein [Gimesia aquarii]QDU07559.1 hypothetical protein V202x_09170 [Gimesia aquarii]